MPYLRLYARDLPIEQKRVIAQKLIEITLWTFELGANQRYQTSIQFITRLVSGVDGLGAAIPHGADFTLEVIGHNLTEEKKRAFAEEAAAMLTPMAPVRLGSRIAVCWESKRTCDKRSAFSSTSSARRLAIHSSWTHSAWRRDRQPPPSPRSRQNSR